MLVIIKQTKRSVPYSEKIHNMVQKIHNMLIKKQKW